MLKIDGKLDINSLLQYIGKPWSIVFLLLVFLLIGYYIYDPNKTLGHSQVEESTIPSSQTELPSTKPDSIRSSTVDYKNTPRRQSPPVEQKQEIHQPTESPSNNDNTNFSELVVIINGLNFFSEKSHFIKVDGMSKIIESEKSEYKFNVNSGLQTIRVVVVDSEGKNVYSANSICCSNPVYINL